MVNRVRNMNRVRNILIVVAVVITSYIIYVGIDCVRLRNSVLGTYPLVTVSEEKKDNRTTYRGLGYSICYYTDSVTTQNNGFTVNIVSGYGAEFRLFDDILVWAWVE